VILLNRDLSRLECWAWAIRAVASSFLGPFAFLAGLIPHVRTNVSGALRGEPDSPAASSLRARFSTPSASRKGTMITEQQSSKPSNGNFVIRARPLTFVIVVLNATFLSLVFVGGGLALALHRRHHDLIWILVSSGSLSGVAAALRLRARFTPTGIDARNAFRSYSARWNDVQTIRVIRAVWYSADPSWYAAMLRVETADGKSFPLRVCTHLSRSQVERLTTLLKERGERYGFQSPASLLELWKVTATTT